jgi:hypothetical protein
MSLLSQFEKRPQFYEILFIACYLMIVNTISATSILMEANRNEQGSSLAIWKPFIWEYSSALSLIMLLPFVISFLKKIPLTWQLIKKNIVWHVLASVIFSLLHIALMVLFRKAIYFSQNLHYEFGDLPTELFYEYRKDAWAYFIFIAIIYCFRFVVSRLIGEAQLINDGDVQASPQQIQKLIVKKLGREFIINIEEIEWLESSGNYVNLHVKDRIYPTRSTLGNFIEQISDQGFFRIHRSYGVNLNMVASITPLQSGDGEVTLKTGKVLSLSRRYRDEFKTKFGQF